jgi:hypothetical protein
MLNRFRSNTWGTLSASFILVLLSACGGVQQPVQPPPINKPIEARNCSAPNGLTLTDIESVTDWINAMPKPLDLPCFIESLPRPLYVNMIDSVFSAQPSNGPGNPRIFIFLDKLILSVVPEEIPDPRELKEQVNLLELSFETKDQKSIKAEIAFPVKRQMNYGEAYIRLISIFKVSDCGICHDREVLVNHIDGQEVFESDILRPYDGSEVPMHEISDAAEICDSTLQAHRCAMLDAIVGDGDLRWQAFDPSIRVL